MFKQPITQIGTSGNIEDSYIQACLRLKPTQSNQKLYELEGDNIIKEIDNPNIHFKYNRIYDDQKSNQFIFLDLMIPILKKLLNGIDCIIFFYGETGSGKTYTMRGQYDNGLVQQSVAFILEHQRQIISTNFQYYELYNEQVYDLLQVEPNSVSNKFKCQEIQFRSLWEFKDIYQLAEQQRQKAQTQMKINSSDIHTFMEISIQLNINQQNIPQKHAKLIFVDLAGSEQYDEQNQFTSRSKQIKIDGKIINTSLYQFIEVIRNISTQDQYINMQDSVLTSILIPYFQNKAQISFIFTIHQDIKNYKQSMQTLMFSQVASQKYTNNQSYEQDGIQYDDKNLELLLLQLEKTDSQITNHLQQKQKQTKKVLQYLINQLQEKDLEIQDVDRDIKDKVREIQDKDREIKDKDREIQYKQREIQLKAREIQVQDMEIQAQNRKIQVQGLEIQVRDREIQVQGIEIQVQDRELQNKQREIQNLNREIQEKDQRIQDQDLEIQQLNLKIQSLKLSKWEKESRSKSLKKINKLRNEHKDKENVSDNEQKGKPEFNFYLESPYKCCEETEFNEMKEIFDYQCSKYDKNPVIFLSKETEEQKIIQFMFSQFNFNIDGILIFQGGNRSYIIVHFNQRPYLKKKYLQDIEDYILIDQIINLQVVQAMKTHLNLQLFQIKCFDNRYQPTNERCLIQKGKIIEYTFLQVQNQDILTCLQTFERNSMLKTFMSIIFKSIREVKLLFYLFKEQNHLMDLYFLQFGQVTVRILKPYLEYSQIQKYYCESFQGQYYKVEIGGIKNCNIRQEIVEQYEDIQNRDIYKGCEVYNL